MSSISNRLTELERITTTTVNPPPRLRPWTPGQELELQAEFIAFAKSQPINRRAFEEFGRALATLEAQ